ncbi:hypothetical protein BP6252_08110 [Coleophoma cylindrospora]|uniref:Glycosyltransferase family 8 protein n=1 Tax=Coleophoma cylindrospora TaxID=1849047 RepID=A0A3D8RBW8_9HELO|nr:hypothetical protein BP6252_08110 [Coleophoma cylindrospora]
MARSTKFVVFVAIALILMFYALQSSVPSKTNLATPPIPAAAPRPHQTKQSEHSIAPPASATYRPPQPIYKPIPPSKALPPVLDNFPLAANAASPADLPPIPAWNVPPKEHVPEVTPLFIGFTRNWRLLQQTVVSYITAGWPPGDIIVVENTGVMDSNRRGRLSMQNPFFLNHTRLNLLGVKVVVTPTLLTFAQLQNYFLFTAIEKDWPQYFWSHMDVLVLAHESLVLDGPAPKAGVEEDMAPDVPAGEALPVEKPVPPGEPVPPGAPVPPGEPVPPLPPPPPMKEPAAEMPAAGKPVPLHPEKPVPPPLKGPSAADALAEKPAPVPPVTPAPPPLKGPSAAEALAKKPVPVLPGTPVPPPLTGPSVAEALIEKPAPVFPGAPVPPPLKGPSAAGKPVTVPPGKPDPHPLKGPAAAEAKVKAPAGPAAPPPHKPENAPRQPQIHSPRAPKRISLYRHAVDVLRETNSDGWAPRPGREWDNSHGPPEHWAHKIYQPHPEKQLTSKRWAARFFHYDNLALVQTKAYEEVGGWDTSIPYYMADCDMYERLLMRGFKITDADAGRFFDVGTSLDDLLVLYRKRSADGTMKNASFLDLNAIIDSDEPEKYNIPDPPPPSTHHSSGRPDQWIDDAPNSPAFQNILDVSEQMQASKANSKSGRNLWKSRQKGGEGEPFYMRPQDFEAGVNTAMEYGRHVFSEKWGHRECDLLNAGLGEKDAWKVQHDWE